MLDSQSNMQLRKRNAVRTVVMDVATAAAESTLSGFGLLLISYGSYGIFHAIVSSALFYFVLGVMLVLTFSQAVRKECLRRMPPVAAKYLYSASLLDLAVDTSSLAHAAAHAVAALGVSSLLHREDISRLSRALPAEYAFLARPGLVHLLPPALQNMLLVDGGLAAHGEVGNDGGILVEEEPGEAQEEDDDEDDWYQAQGQGQGQVQERGDEDEDDDDEGFFALPRVPRAMQPAGVARAPLAVRVRPVTAVTTVLGPLGTSSSSSSSAAGPNFALLEQTVRQLGAEYAVRWTAQVQSMALQGMHYVASGGALSAEQLLGAAAAFTAAGTACRVVVSRRAGPTSSALARTLAIAAPVLFGVAATASGMLAVRTFGGSAAALWRAGLEPIRRRLGELWRARGLHGKALSAAIALSTLLMLAAFRMRVQLRQLRWVAAVLVQRLRRGSAQAWRLLMAE